MTKVSYNVLGAAIFSLGLLMLIQLPGDPKTFGDHLFTGTAIENLLSQKNIPFAPIFAAILQAAGILLFAIWLKQEKQEYYKIYQKFELLIIGILLLGASPIINHTIETTAKTYSFSGKDGVQAVEYIKEKSSCHSVDDSHTVQCHITLKNYQHHAQKLAISFYKEESRGKLTDSLAHVSLIQREEKRVPLTFSTKELDTQQLKQLSSGTVPDLALHNLKKIEKGP
ncbi:hypothetical protein [Mesobacillus zeae]|uniref:Uncharacterized protein n=1 Tax=Mesobacillus zeae TaxID=1917180 RepID=A0A398BN43_9BACI|nr:hypothetical protein [Mesobacillus zeae]RID88773.1 hypothetical protein D1970_00545 [Mesobacillus zeae]